MGGVLRRGARSVPRPSLLIGEAAPLGRGRELSYTAVLLVVAMCVCVAVWEWARAAHGNPTRTTTDRTTLNDDARKIPFCFILEPGSGFPVPTASGSIIPLLHAA